MCFCVCVCTCAYVYRGANQTTRAQAPNAEAGAVHVRFPVLLRAPPGPLAWRTPAPATPITQPPGGQGGADPIERAPLAPHVAFATFPSGFDHAARGWEVLAPPRVVPHASAAAAGVHPAVSGGGGGGGDGGMHNRMGDGGGDAARAEKGDDAAGPAQPGAAAAAAAGAMGVEASGVGRTPSVPAAASVVPPSPPPAAADGGGGGGGGGGGDGGMHNRMGGGGGGGGGGDGGMHNRVGGGGGGGWRVVRHDFEDAARGAGRAAPACVSPRMPREQRGGSGGFGSSAEVRRAQWAYA